MKNEVSTKTLWPNDPTPSYIAGKNVYIHIDHKTVTRILIATLFIITKTYLFIHSSTGRQEKWPMAPSCFYCSNFHKKYLIANLLSIK